MSQYSNPTLEPRRYTRADFTALRAYLNRIPSSTILDLYYNDDDRELLGIESGRELVTHLDNMRDDLVARATNQNPHLATALVHARDRGVWSPKAVNYLVGAADEDQTAAHPDDLVSRWFRTAVAKRLKGEGVATLADLVQLIRRRGATWNRAIPYLGRRKATAIIKWLMKNERTLGELPVSITNPAPAPVMALTEFNTNSTTLMPLERLKPTVDLDGTYGANRGTNFALIGANNDLDAINTYLDRFTDRPQTHRAYRKELERCLLWCLRERRKPMSSLLVEDCTAYLEFLKDIPVHWRGQRQPRNSIRWFPFADNDFFPDARKTVGLSPESRRYALRALRAFFAYLLDSRYLSGNPWALVPDPVAVKRVKSLQVKKALTGSLWEKLSNAGGIFDQLCDMGDEELVARYEITGPPSHFPQRAQMRLFRAATLIVGEVGLRRAELAGATRDALSLFNSEAGLWKLSVVGKGSKERNVFLMPHVIAALRAHWEDRGEDFDAGESSAPLLSPIIVPNTRRSRKKHAPEEGLASKARGFSGNGIYTLITAGLLRIADDNKLDLDFAERAELRRAAVHSFRHTFGKQAAVNKLPLDVLQKLLGHASLNTTSVYVDTEDERSAAEIARWQGRGKRN